MNAHPTKTGRFGNGLMRYQPLLACAKPVHLHRKADGSCIDRSNTKRLQLTDDLSNYTVCLVNDVVKFDICDGSHWSSDVLAIHPAYNADDGFRPWEHADDICTVCRDIFSIDLDEAYVVRPRFQTQRSKPVSIQRLRRGRLCLGSMRYDGWMAR
jgi:hypothetical protein